MAKNAIDLFPSLHLLPALEAIVVLCRQESFVNLQGNPIGSRSVAQFYLTD